MLHHQGLFNGSQYNLSWEGTAFDIQVVGEFMAISATSLFPIKPKVQYFRDSPWRGQHVSVTPAKVIILDFFYPRLLHYSSYFNCIIFLLHF
jgi:hypothetical protein